jgi:hypothetical protein
MHLHSKQIPFAISASAVLQKFGAAQLFDRRAHISLSGRQLHFELRAERAADVFGCVAAVAPLPYKVRGLVELMNQTLTAIQDQQFPFDHARANVGSLLWAKNRNAREVNSAAPQTGILLANLLHTFTSFLF